jgi:hypothetical protein
VALLRQLHPDWSVEEIQALIMNTATADLYTSAAKTTREAVSRVGSGRINLNKASTGNVVVFNATDRGRVNLSFGVVEVPVDGSVAISKQLKIRNKGTAPVTYNVSYDRVNTASAAPAPSATPNPAAGTFSADRAQVTVQPGATEDLAVLFTSTGSALRHARDPATPATQDGFGRQWLTEVAGYGVFTPTSGDEPTIRVALHAAPKPAGVMRTQQKSVAPTSNNASFALKLTGRPVFSGGFTSTDVVGLAKPYEAQYVSPQAGNPDLVTKPNVIKHVGITSDYSSIEAGKKENTVITWAIDAFGDATLPAFFDSNRQIEVDVNFDKTADYIVYASSIRNANNQHQNVYASAVQNEATGNGNFQYFVNGFAGNALDTNALNTSLIQLSADASELGYTGAGQSFFQYRVKTYGRLDGAEVDETPWMYYDIAKPGLDTAGGFTEPTGTYYLDQPNTNVGVQFNAKNYKKNKSRGVMMVHTYNGQGEKSEVITITSPLILNFHPESGPVGTLVSISGARFNEGTNVKFSPNVQAKDIKVLSSTTISCKVPPGAVTGPITVSNPVGSHTSSQKFTVTPAP